MLKQNYIILLLAVVLILSGCSTNRTMSEYTDTPSSVDSRYFLNDLPYADIQSLPVIDISLTEVDCCYQGCNYLLISNEEMAYIVTPYWWQLDLSATIPIGITKADQIVYAHRDEDGTIISLIVADANGSLKWFLAEDSSLLNLSIHSFDDFTISYYSEEDTRSTPQQIWEAHVGTGFENNRSFLLIEDDNNIEYYNIKFISNDHPELSYTLVYAYVFNEYNGLYIFNLPVDGYVLLP